MGAQQTTGISQKRNLNLHQTSKTKRPRQGGVTGEEGADFCHAKWGGHHLLKWENGEVGKGGRKRGVVVESQKGQNEP